MKKQGFSVAEIVVTLMVIGIIAVMVVPSLMNSSNDTANITAWRKVFSSMKSAWDDIVFNYGGDVTNGFNSNQAMLEPMIPLLNVHPTTATQCFRDVTNGCFIKSVKGLDASLQPAGKPGVTLLDGTALYIADADSNMKCAKKSGEVYYCGIMVVDVNSQKGPNILGKDIFVLYMMPSEILPSGLKDTFPYQSNCINGEGRGCSAKYLVESNLIYNEDK